jgi:hypothetical protein
LDAIAFYAFALGTFLVHAGTTYAVELNRALAIFEGTWKVELVAESGPAFGVVERIHLFAKQAGQAVNWTYQDEPDKLAVTYSGGQGEPHRGLRLADQSGRLRR